MKNQWLLESSPVPKDQREALWRNELKIHSQTGEDGIIQYIFNLIGTKDKRVVEIGIEDGKECNSANLILNFGWSGLLMEGNRKYAERAREYYSSRPVKVKGAFVTRDNVNSLIKESGIEGEIDLLSIDIDGNDYWIWEAIDCVKPRVVIVEYNSILGPEPRTIRYNPKFERLKAHSSGFYYGSSLAALTKLAEKKGYILVGCNSSGFNAFFVKKKDAKNKLKSLSPSEADPLPNGRNKTLQRFNIIKKLPLDIV